MIDSLAGSKIGEINSIAEILQPTKYQHALDCSQSHWTTLAHILDLGGLIRCGPDQHHEMKITEGGSKNCWKPKLTDGFGCVICNQQKTVSRC